MDRNLLPALGSIPLSRLGTHDIDRHYRNLRSRGAQDGTALQPATVRRIHGILRRALEQGVRWKWISVNPAASASPAKAAAELAPPAPSQVATLFNLALSGDADFATFVMVAGATGARRSELVALRWCTVDLDARIVTVRRGVVLGPDGLVEKDTKTHGLRRVALDATTVAQLRGHRQRAMQRAALCGPELDDDAFVFSHELDGSRSWRPDSTSRAFLRLRERAGCDSVRLHDLRHYVATRLLVAGVDVRTVAGRLGHRNASTTLNVYAHFVAESDRDAANVLGRLFDDASDELGPPKG
jgi:integrase